MAGGPEQEVSLTKRLWLLDRRQQQFQVCGRSHVSLRLPIRHPSVFASEGLELFEQPARKVIIMLCLIRVSSCPIDSLAFLRPDDMSAHHARKGLEWLKRTTVPGQDPCWVAGWTPQVGCLKLAGSDAAVEVAVGVAGGCRFVGRCPVPACPARFLSSNLDQIVRAEVGAAPLARMRSEVHQTTCHTLDLMMRP